MNIWEFKKNYYLFSALLGATVWLALYIYFVAGILTNPLSSEIEQNTQNLLTKQEEIKKFQQMKSAKEVELKQIEDLQKKAFDINQAKRFYTDIITVFNGVNIIFELKLENISNHDKYLNLGIIQLSFKKKVYYLPDEDVQKLVISFIKLYLFPLPEFEITTKDNKITFTTIKDAQNGGN